MTSILIGLLLCAAAPPSVRTVPAKKFRLAVTDTTIQGQALDPIVGQSLSAVVAAEAELRAGDRFNIISRNEIRAMMKQMEAQQLAGSNTSGTSLSTLFDADFLLTSSVALIGEEWVFTVELSESAGAKVRQRQVARYKGDAAGLVELVRPYITMLFDRDKATAYRGQLDVLVTEDKTQLLIDEKDLGLSPIVRENDLRIGTHRVRALKSGYLPFEADVVINRDETSVLAIELIDEDSIRPWYRKWWVWTAGGAVAVAITTTAIILSGNQGGSITLQNHPLPGQL